MLRKFFSDNHGRIVVAQRPNLPLLVWALTAVAAHMWSGKVAEGLRSASWAALTVWAVMEVATGASYFRRALGVVVLAWSVYALFW